MGNKASKISAASSAEPPNHNPAISVNSSSILSINNDSKYTPEATPSPLEAGNTKPTLFSIKCDSIEGYSTTFNKVLGDIKQELKSEPELQVTSTQNLSGPIVKSLNENKSNPSEKQSGRILYSAKLNETKPIIASNCVNDAKPIPTIVLIGSTGSGKSSFGNWLYNFSAGDELFKRGESMVACTQDVVSFIKEVPYDVPQKTDETVRVKLVDTPGLNEKDAGKDLEHMVQLMQVVHNLKTISMVVLCVPFDSREDNQTVETLRYYKDLFQPVFSAGNLWVVLTKTSTDVFERTMEDGGKDKWNDLINKRRVEVSKILDMEITPDMIEYVNSVPPRSQLKKLMKKGIGEPMENMLLHHSALMRHKFLTWAWQSHPISMDCHLFPLPPCIEKQRRSMLVIYEEKRKQLQRTLDLENNVRGELMKTERDLKTQITNCNGNIEEWKREKCQKSQLQFTPPKVVDGDTLFGGDNVTLRLDCPFEGACTLVTQSYNCKINSLANENSSSVLAEVRPDLVHVLRKNFDGKRKTWYARVQLEYRGEECYEKEINTLSSRIKDEDTKVEELEKTYAASCKDHIRRDNQIEVHQKEMKELNDKCPLLETKYFELEAVAQFTTQLTSLCQVTNINTDST